MVAVVAVGAGVAVAIRVAVGTVSLCSKQNCRRKQSTTSKQDMIVLGSGSSEGRGDVWVAHEGFCGGSVAPTPGIYQPPQEPMDVLRGNVKGNVVDYDGDTTACDVCAIRKITQQHAHQGQLRRGVVFSFFFGDSLGPSPPLALGRFKTTSESP